MGESFQRRKHSAVLLREIHQSLEDRLGGAGDDSAMLAALIDERRARTRNFPITLIRSLRSSVTHSWRAVGLLLAGFPGHPGTRVWFANPPFHMAGHLRGTPFAEASGPEPPKAVAWVADSSEARLTGGVSMVAALSINLGSIE